MLHVSFVGHNITQTKNKKHQKILQKSVVPGTKLTHLILN
jgi:hypothetical protein